MSDLKPCPFCGGDAYTREETGRHHNDGTWDVHCRGCNAVIREEWTEERAIEAWNERSTLKTKGGQISGVREAFLKMIADGELKVNPDEGGCFFTINTNERHLRALCSALDIEPEHEELLEDAIYRAVDTPALGALLQQEGE